ncbi:MAG TPA: betaine/proline/choline family ABC transporter ATP-binding protein [Dehalococcoidia bacterium]|nr:betaine/proline/choline family ABC transporter ATP-binding protein [Dehalococcoidia bacterium]
MIRLEQVTKKYGETTAVDGLSFEVNAGEVCVLIGPSGCGKTTTLRIINRLLEPTSGRVLIDNEDTGRVRPEKLRQSIGYAIQSVGLFPHMTVATNIAVVPELLHWEKERITARTEELLKLVGLPAKEYAGKYPKQLSGGEAQRIGVARALAADPPMLLMDEPFGAVDPLTRERLQAQFVRIQQELRKTVILVTHDLDEAIRLADRIAIMDAGKLVQYDTPETILSRPVNKFVHDFVGTDRALKRLSRIGIAEFVKQAASIHTGDTVESAISACEVCPWVWVVDDSNRLLGWVDRNSLRGTGSISESMVTGDPDTIALNNTATLREALSRMLGLGLKSIPVVDEAGRLTGEVDLGDIEAATSEAGE